MKMIAVTAALCVLSLGGAHAQVPFPYPRPSCPPACGPGVYMPLPTSPYIYMEPHPYRNLGPGANMPLLPPAPLNPGNELLEEFNRWRYPPIYAPIPRRR
jgi:hypothetical protein